MARSRYDIANSAIRIFLQEVGATYDKERGFEPFIPKVAQQDEILAFFGHECCYCGAQMTRKTTSLDHLIPMNKKELGFTHGGMSSLAVKRATTKNSKGPGNNSLSRKLGLRFSLRERSGLLNSSPPNDMIQT